jgi:hypothetical protein
LTKLHCQGERKKGRFGKGERERISMLGRKREGDSIGGRKKN